MYQLQLNFKGKTKKITVEKTLQSQELAKMIAYSFNLTQRIVGVTDKIGKFYQLSKLNSELAFKDTFSLVTAKDVKEENMSFASQYHQRQSKQQFLDDHPSEPTLQLPAYPNKSCLGIISDIQIFEELLLMQGKVTVVAAFTSQKPQQLSYEHFLFQNDYKNSVIVYSGVTKVCEFYIPDWNLDNREVSLFIQGLLSQSNSYLFTKQKQSPFPRSDGFGKKSRAGEAVQLSNKEEKINQISQIKESFIQNLTHLLEEGDLSQLQFYKLKGQLLENPTQFMKKYQMGTKNGFKFESREASKEEKREKKEYQEQNKSYDRREKNKQYQQRGQSKQYFRRESNEEKRGRSANHNKRYQIPIIVRKYNNVVEKISTSYPLSREQQQSVNLILELELKGLITQKQAGIFKSLILQEEVQTFKLFQDYFEDNIDQLELASRLKNRRNGGQRQDSSQKNQHDMRVLIKYSKQDNYQLLRKLVLEENKHVIGALSLFRSNKDPQILIKKLERIANYYRTKEELDDEEQT